MIFTIMGIFAAGFISGYAVRAFISRHRRRQLIWQ
jgi:hypothetical protein